MKRSAIVFYVFLALAMAAAVWMMLPHSVTLQDRINELRDKGYSVQTCDKSFSQIRVERGGTWSETADWNTFLQQIQTVKANLGFVTVYVCEQDGVLWIHATETTYYYHRV